VAKRKRQILPPVEAAAAVPQKRPPTDPVSAFLGITSDPEPLARRDAWIVFLFYPLLVALFFVPLLTDGSVLATSHGDVANYWLPMREYLGRVLRTGHIPLWNPHIMSGTPFLAANQSGAFYPPNWLFALLPGAFVLNFETVASFWFGLAAMYVLARRLGRSVQSSMVAGLVFGFSGFAILHWLAGHFVFVVEWPFTPLAVLAWFVMQSRSCEAGPASRYIGPVLWVSGCVGMQYFSGHPQIVYFTVLILAGLQAGWCIHCLRSGRGRTAVLGSVWLGVALALSGLLVLVQALPTLLHSGQTVRGTNIGMSYYTDQSQPLSNIITLFAPAAWGINMEDQFCAENFWEVNGYVGAFACALALAGLVLPRRISPFQGTCLVMTLLASLLALGGNAPFFRAAFHVVPGLSLFRDPGRFGYIVMFCTALLAASGFDGLRVLAAERSPLLRTAIMRLLVIVLGAMVLHLILFREGAESALFLRQFASRVPDELRGRLSPEAASLVFSRYNAYVLAACATAALCAALLALLWSERYRSRAAWAIAILTAAELFVYAWPFRSSFKSADLDWPANISSLIEKAGPLYRMGGAGYAADYNHAMSAGLRHVWGYEPTVSHRYCLALSESQRFKIEGMAPAFIYLVKPSPLLDALGMRFTLLPRQMRPADPSWRAVASSERRVLYENPSAIPRCFTVDQARVVPEEEAIKLANSLEFHPREMVLLEERPPAMPGPVTDLATSGSVSVKVDDAEFFEAAVTMKRDGFLVLMDTMLPGWSATVDGSPSRIYRANSVGRAVFLREGTHIVQMRYRAPGFAVGAVVSGIGWAAWIATAIVLGIRRRRRRSDDGSETAPAPVS
jgi:hypothetical protein